MYANRLWGGSPIPTTDDVIRPKRRRRRDLNPPGVPLLLRDLLHLKQETLLGRKQERWAGKQNIELPGTPGKFE